MGSKYADYLKFAAKEAMVFDSSMTVCVVNKAPTHGVISFEVSDRSKIYNIPRGQVNESTRINVSNLMSPGKVNIFRQSQI